MPMDWNISKTGSFVLLIPYICFEYYVWNVVNWIFSNL